MSKISPHPFDPLSPIEISKVAEHVRAAFPSDNVYFRVITLSEPLKADMVPFLEAEHRRDVGVSRPPRLALVQLYLNERSSNSFYELKVDLGSGLVVEKQQLLGRHTHVDANDMQKAEMACLQDERVQASIREMKLPDEAVVCVEPWTYGTDGMADMSKKITMCYFYMRLQGHPDSNFYAYPLDICAEMSGDLKVLKVYHLPSGANDSMSDNPKPFDRRKIHASSEYHPDLLSSHRTTTKPYRVLQPEGPSFTTSGNQVSWEKWTFRVGFNYREGLILHDICYENRSLFYRISLSEMFVPYGDSRSPYVRKAAFDLGNDGAGVNANNLQLGCDCLGHIKYFDGWHNTHTGEPLKLPNVICCHEIDDGILWKHTNHRTQNPVVVRSRVLVLQTIITVSNYEYIFAFHFSQDASIHYEVRATGILSTVPIDIGDSVPYGTIVAPGVMAPYHQHLFCLRINPALDSYKGNSLVIEESHPLPLDPHENSKIPNPFGVGYTTSSTIIDHESGHDLSHGTNRTFKLVNESRLNPTTGTPIGYKLMPCYSQLLLAHPSSFHARRSEFGAHAVWVTQHHDDELFPSGRHTMQSLGGEGVASWIAGRANNNNNNNKRLDQEEQQQAATNCNTNGNTNDNTKDNTNDNSNVRNTDIVLWHTFGSTHNPRLEDWPTMPCEKMTVGLKPVNFFSGNPALDCAVGSRLVNGGVLV